MFLTRFFLNISISKNNIFELKGQKTCSNFKQFVKTFFERFLNNGEVNCNLYVLLF